MIINLSSAHKIASIDGLLFLISQDTEASKMALNIIFQED